MHTKLDVTPTTPLEIDTELGPVFSVYPATSGSENHSFNEFKSLGLRCSS